MSTEFRILGELEVLQDGDLVSLGSPRQRAVLARLLISPDNVVTTDRLLEDLWRGDATEAAKHTLHVYVSRLRKALGPDSHRLVRQGTGYRFSVAPTELDSTRFEQLGKDGRDALARGDAEMAKLRLEEALALWRGRALSDFADETYARDDAIRLEELRLATLEQRIWADLDLGLHGTVAPELQDLVAQHPLRETLWEQLMLALYRCGRQADALRTYQTARGYLAEELGIEPGPALRRLEEQILRQDLSLEASAKKPSADPGSRLPLQRTSFVGRKHELARSSTLLETSRLLTFTGPPGSGKTRLALRLASDHEPSFRHGCFFVSLAAVSNPRLMVNTIARSLGLHDVPGREPIEGAKAYLSERETLLILDNFEQILPAAPQVGELLDAAPRLTVVVTSRAPLGISGEQEFPVPPLSLPPATPFTSVDAMEDSDAVALFVARSQATDPGFELTPINAHPIAQITARVDGLPLAIELAAARIKLLPPQDLLDRLENRLTILTTAPADSSGRHRTMRDAIAWSYELLEPTEQLLFRTLGSFRGGFSLEAAAAVANLPDSETLEGINTLLTRSLLFRPVTTGQARFSMLEMIREFAIEQLDNTEERSASANRHAAFFLSLAEVIEPQLTQDPGGRGLERLIAETDNLRAALRHAIEIGDASLGLDLASSVWRFWQSTDQMTEGREWLETLLHQPDPAPESRARGLTASAGLAYWQADYQVAQERYAEALGAYRDLDDRHNEADILYSMSLTALWKNDLDEGERLAADALAIFTELDSKEGLGKVLVAQATLLWWRGDYGSALDLWEEALSIAKEFGDHHLALTGQVGLASLTFLQGRIAEAISIAWHGVTEAMDARNTHIAVWMLDLVAAFTAAESPEAAVRLAGAVETLRQEAGGGVLPEALQLKDARSIATPLLGAETVTHAWRQGLAMDLDEAVAAAKQLTSRHTAEAIALIDR